MGGGNVVSYDLLNVMMLIGCVVVVNWLVEIIECVDCVGDEEVEIVKFCYVLVLEMVCIIDSINKL